eukprot:7377798-Alexandrium_andersonii.AAC.1
MLALQERTQGETPAGHPVMLWLVQRAGGLLAKRLVGHDGRAAFERLFGKPSRGDGYAFGEQVHFRARPNDDERDSARAGGQALGLGAAGVQPHALRRRAPAKSVK